MPSLSGALVGSAFVEDDGGLEEERIGGEGRRVPGVRNCSGGRVGGGGGGDGGGESGGGGRRGGGGGFGFGVEGEEGGEDAWPAAVATNVDYRRLPERETFAVSPV